MKKQLFILLLLLLPALTFGQQYAYINASSLKLRTQGNATAPVKATVDGASRVEVVHNMPNGWSAIKVFDYSGFVKSSYLVSVRDSVQADGIDWSFINGFGPSYASVTATEDVPITAPARSSKRAKVATVYMCDSGNTVKYHATSNCRGLNRCNASVVRISKAEAQQSMDPCKFCY